MLTEIDMEALLIRHEAVMKNRRDLDLTAEEALAYVICPTPKVLEASLEVALQNGARSAARELLKRAKPPKKRPARPGEWGRIEVFEVESVA